MVDARDLVEAEFSDDPVAATGPLRHMVVEDALVQHQRQDVATLRDVQVSLIVYSLSSLFLRGNIRLFSH